MAKIRIQNIGPLRDTGWIELTPILVFLGKQGVGKSIILKTICHCRWIEKDMMLFCRAGDTKGITYPFENYTNFCRFDKSFFNKKSKIEYESEILNITITNDSISVRRKRKQDTWQKYLCEKLSLIPAERISLTTNPYLLSSYRSSINDFLFNHLAEWYDIRENYTKEKAHQLITSPSIKYFYDKTTHTDKLLINDTQEIEAKYGSSGQQSAFPLELIADFLTQLCGKKIADNPQAQRDRKNFFYENRQKLGEDFLKQFEKYKRVMLFIEEPEVNLFPNAQIDLMFYLVNCIHKAQEKTGENSYLTIATHSPYIIEAIDTMMLIAKTYLRQPQKLDYIKHNKTLSTIPIIKRTNFFDAYFVDDNLCKKITNKNGIDSHYLDKRSEWLSDNIFSKLYEIYD